MKKTVALILAVVLLLSFAGCGEKEPKIKQDEVIGLIEATVFDDYKSQMDSELIDMGADTLCNYPISTVIAAWEDEVGFDHTWRTDLPSAAKSAIGSKLDEKNYYYADLQMYWYGTLDSDIWSEMVFSVDKETGEVAPVAYTTSGDWSRYEADTPADQLGMFFVTVGLALGLRAQ